MIFYYSQNITIDFYQDEIMICKGKGIVALFLELELPKSFLLFLLGYLF